MTRKRFCKLLMGRGCERNWTRYAADVCHRYGVPYAKMWRDLCGMVWEGRT